MTNADILAIASPGSQALKNAKYEKYCRLRASALPRIQAYREVGWGSKSKDDVVYINACRLDRRPEIQDRIAFLTRQEEDLVVEKRRRLEETLWSIHEANIGDYFETHEIDGKTIERPKRLADLPAEIQKNIEKITIDGKGRAVPQLYSKLAASRELRKMLEIGRPDDRTDVQRLSDAELVAQLRDQAKQLGIEINLNYSFLQQQKPDDEEQG
jgi:Terminase small subunit